MSERVKSEELVGGWYQPYDVPYDYEDEDEAEWVRCIHKDMNDTRHMLLDPVFDSLRDLRLDLDLKCTLRKGIGDLRYGDSWLCRLLDKQAMTIHKLAIILSDLGEWEK